MDTMARGEEVVVMRSLDGKCSITRWRMIQKSGNRFPDKIKGKQNISNETVSN
jgi:hypothetical protein